ncbi:MAG: CheB methylesterase domain-containing protein, partial [Candidatus Eremiobacterota bacterium]
PASARSGRQRPRRVGIGTSTGGPAALVQVLGSLPANFDIPLLVVIHINEPFGEAFASWLDGRVPLRVRYPEDGERAAGGTVLLAPPDRHLVVERDRVRLSRAPERHSCRPSVDVLFESMATELGPAAAACLLTGMGRDGASGLLRVRQAGGFTLAQDEATSVVYGMPREAARLQAAQSVLPLAEIGPTVARLAD